MGFPLTIFSPKRTLSMPNSPPSMPSRYKFYMGPFVNIFPVKSPLADVYMPRLINSDGPAMHSQVEKIVKNAKLTAGASGVSVDVAVVFPENVFEPYKQGISYAKRFADSISKILPSDIFFTVCFNICVKAGIKSRNEAFLVTSDGWHSSPKREYRMFDVEQLVLLFGRCDYEKMCRALMNHHFDLPKNLPFCKERKIAEVCNVQQCSCFETESIWIDRAKKLQDMPFLTVAGKNLVFEYGVCGDVDIFSRKYKSNTISLISAYGLSRASGGNVLSLAQKRRVVLVNDGFKHPKPQIAQDYGRTRSDTSDGCKIVAVF